MKNILTLVKKYLPFTFFIFLFIFNLNVLVDNNRFVIQLVNSVFALPEGEGGDDGGGGAAGCYTFGLHRAVVCYNVWYDSDTGRWLMQLGSQVACDPGNCICYSTPCI